MDRKRDSGLDALPTLLHSPQEQLRASAQARLAAIREDIQQAVRVADEAFRHEEEAYLAAVAAWTRAATEAERAQAALAVGRLQVALAAADTQRQSARYPHRFIQQKDLLRNVIDPDTRDLRTIPFPVFVERTMTTTPTDRTILLSATAAS